MTEQQMNKKQQTTIDKIRETILFENNDRYAFQKDSPHEIKYEKTTMEKGWRFVSYVLEIGLVGDEGTYAALFARDRRHFFIGPRGGVKLVNAKHTSKANGFWNAIHALTDY